jgi:hypothetical protein
MTVRRRHTPAVSMFAPVVSTSTVKTQVAHIYRKLDVHNRAELAASLARRPPATDACGSPADGPKITHLVDVLWRMPRHDGVESMPRSRRRNSRPCDDTTEPVQ